MAAAGATGSGAAGTCGRSFWATTGTAVAHLKTPVEEVARTLLVVRWRGRLRAAREIMGH